MNQVTTPENTSLASPSTVRELTPSEIRLDAICDLVDEELRNSYAVNLEPVSFTRRVTGDIDQALTEVTHWLIDDQND